METTEERAWDIVKKLNAQQAFDFNFAILILNQPLLCDFELMKSLWNGASYRILVDGGVNRWLSYLQEHGANEFEDPNIICGDFDSIKLRDRTYFTNKGVHFIQTTDQDETDFLKALRILAGYNEKRIKFAFAICENSGRLDQILSNLSTLLRAREFMSHIDIFLLAKETISWVLKAGTHNIIATQKSIDEGWVCGLIPINGPVTVTTMGLKWNLDNDILKMDSFISTSNTYNDPEIRVVCNGCLIWTTQHCSAKI